MAELEKAFLEVEGGQRIPCLFNPNQISVARRNAWSAESMPGKGVGRLRYTGAQSGSMQMELIFDTTSEGTPVTKHTGKILGLMDVDVTLPGSDETTHNARPPFLTFHWGDLHSFKAVITDLQLVFTYFSASGIPLRAKLNLSMQQYEESHAFGPQNPTSGTPRPHRVHRIQPGETLDRIAARYYGDATRWRSLASANNIEDPLAMRPGTLLSVPRIERR